MYMLIKGVIAAGHVGPNFQTFKLVMYFEQLSLQLTSCCIKTHLCILTYSTFQHLWSFSFQWNASPLRGVLILLLLNRYPPKACVDRKIIVFSELKGTIYEGGIRGVWILQNRTEIPINTAQNNIRKPQTAQKLPENFKTPQTTWYCKTAILRLEIKISAKLHQKSSKTASLQTLTPSSYIHVHWPTNVNATEP